MVIVITLTFPTVPAGRSVGTGECPWCTLNKRAGLVHPLHGSVLWERVGPAVYHNGGWACVHSCSLPGVWLPWGMTSLVQKSNRMWTSHECLNFPNYEALFPWPSSTPPEGPEPVCPSRGGYRVVMHIISSARSSSSLPGSGSSSL